jgi:hypothetical protein
LSSRNGSAVRARPHVDVHLRHAGHPRARLFAAGPHHLCLGVARDLRSLHAVLRHPTPHDQPPSTVRSRASRPSEDCASRDVTITFQRTSSRQKSADARLVLRNLGVITDFAGDVGGVTLTSADQVPSSVGGSSPTGSPLGHRGDSPFRSRPVRQSADRPRPQGISTTCNNISGYNDTCSASATGLVARLRATSISSTRGDLHRNGLCLADRDLQLVEWHGLQRLR